MSVQTPSVTRIALALCATLILPATRSFADDTGVRLQGKWVLGEFGNAIGPESFRRGLQASGLVFRKGELWSVGDQRSQYPGHIFRIDPKTGRLRGAPLKLSVPAARPGENAHFASYRAIPNSDFEGLTIHPTDASRLIAVTEDKTPWIVSIRLRDGGEKSRSASIEHLAEIDLAEIVPWRNDTNFRMEGIATSSDGKLLYLAFERARDDLPRILTVPLADALEKSRVRCKVLPIDFASVKRRAGKERARLNINDIQCIQLDGRDFLLAVARDQERILVIDIEKRSVGTPIDLDLRDPLGRSMLWVSPEGLAHGAGKIWIVNDPDSVRGNYRLADAEMASGRFAEYAPLLFEVPLEKLLDLAKASASGDGDK